MVSENIKPNSGITPEMIRAGAYMLFRTDEDFTSSHDRAWLVYRAMEAARSAGSDPEGIAAEILNSECPPETD